MKILFAAVFSQHSTNCWQARGFEELGHEVDRYDYRDKLNGLTKAKRDEELIERCRHTKPDMILFSKCNGMSYRVVEECRKVGKTAMWYMDALNNYDQELKSKLKHCDLVFASCAKVLEDAKKYCKNTYRLQGGFDPDLHRPLNEREIYRASFIGSIHSNRKQILDEVQPRIFDGVYGLEHSKIVAKTMVNLNLCTDNAPSNRVYKILASKGFLLSDPWDGVEEDFVPGQDLILFYNMIDLKKKLNFYLQNSSAREKIARSGYLAVQRYNHINFAERILEAVNA